MSPILKAKVFISCGQRKDSEEIPLVQQVAECLEQKGFDPYIAVQQQSLKGLKENIFEELCSSEYFLFIDLKREKLEGTPLHRGSLFCHQELAIASFLNMPLIGFQEDGTKKDDGILNFLQANCKLFTDRKKLSSLVIDKIKKSNWEPNGRTN